MILEFSKLNGLGNDFIFIDDFSQEIDLSEDQVRWLCDRHFGIGADGVILVRPPKQMGSIAYMHYINADGSLAQMCGNGVRCFAKYLVDRGFVNTTENFFIADTLAGQRQIRFDTNEKGKLINATVNMGNPILDPLLIPTTLSSTAQYSPDVAFVNESSISSPWGEFAFTCVSMGNPHAVCFIDAWDNLPEDLFSNKQEKSLATLKMDTLGSFFVNHHFFPEGVNVEIAQIGRIGIDMRVFERGVGETLACGTGACATGVAACLTGRSGRKNQINLLGGSLLIDWQQDDTVLMTGTASEAFSGTVTLI